MIVDVDRQPAKRNTWQREAVRGALRDAEVFVSAQALHRRLSDEGTAIGLATVYRALASLSNEAEADTYTSEEGEVLYRACAMDEHHHHLICRACGRAVEITADPVEQWAKRVAAEHGFAEPRHVVDVFGLCPDCTAARDDAS